MKFTKINIKNYKPYYGEQTIEVPQFQEGKIILIKGINGAGKTTLLNGLIWALYNQNYDYKSMINDLVLYNLGIGNKDEMYIKIYFEHNEKNHILERNIIVEETANESYRFNDKRKLEILYPNAESDIFNDEIRISNYINSILNESVKDYFFFNGARIEKFTKDNHYKDVQKAIKNLLKIKTVKRAKDHIKTVVDDIRRSINEEINDDILNEISNKIQNMENKLEKKEKEKENIKKEIKSVKNNINSSLKELEHFEKNSNFKAQKDKYSELYEDVKEKLQKEEEKLESKLKISYNIFADDLLKDAVEILDNNYKKGNLEISSSSIKILIKKTLQKKSCYLCERDLNKETEDILKDKLPDLSIDTINQQDYLQMKNKFITIKDKGETFYKEISKIQKNIVDMKNDLKNYDDFIKEYDAKINKELPGAKEYRNVIKELRSKSDELRDEKENIDSKIKEIKHKLKKLETEYEEKNSKLEISNHKKNKLELSQKIKNEIDVIYNNYEERQIPKINKKVKKIFDRLIRKENIYTDIYIDEEYRINVLRKTSKENKLHELSYGERQILSLSLILSLADVSGDSAPFVMDTPLGNLDPVHRKKILETIPNLLPQMFLLVTGSEFTQDLYDICSNEIAAEYKLDFNNGITQIREEKY